MCRSPYCTLFRKQKASTWQTGNVSFRGVFPKVACKNYWQCLNILMSDNPALLYQWKMLVSYGSVMSRWKLNDESNTNIMRCCYSLSHLTGQPALEDNDSHTSLRRTHEHMRTLYETLEPWPPTNLTDNMRRLTYSFGLHLICSTSLREFHLTYPPTCTHTHVLLYIFARHFSLNLGLESESGSLLTPPPSVYKYTTLWVFSRALLPTDTA